MAKPKKPKSDARRKLQTQFRLHPLLRKQLDALVEQKLTNLSTEITEAIRKHLTENGLWPPPTE